jgi:hypothetical protein
MTLVNPLWNLELRVYGDKIDFRVHDSEILARRAQGRTMLIRERMRNLVFAYSL